MLQVAIFSWSSDPDKQTGGYKGDNDPAVVNIPLTVPPFYIDHLLAVT
jgi:hypothetical protein